MFGVHERRYGTHPLRLVLHEKGHRVGHQALRTGLRWYGRKALLLKVYMPRTTNSTHGLRCAPNRLLDQPRPV